MNAQTYVITYLSSSSANIRLCWYIFKLGADARVSAFWHRNIDEIESHKADPEQTYDQAFSFYARGGSHANVCLNSERDPGPTGY